MNEQAPPAGEPPGYAAASHVAAGLAKLGLVLRSEAWHARGRTGLTPTQGQILTLLRIRDPEPLMLREIAAGMAVTSATASESLDALVGKGLAQRERSRTDARALAVRLTDAGRREADAGASWPDALLAAAAELEAEEQAVFLRALTKMIRRLQLAGRISVVRMCATCQFFRPNAHQDDPQQPHHCAFVDSPFGDAQLRIDCVDHRTADPDLAERNWRRFAD